MRIVASSNWH